MECQLPIAQSRPRLQLGRILANDVGYGTSA